MSSDTVTVVALDVTENWSKFDIVLKSSRVFMKGRGWICVDECNFHSLGITKQS